MKYGRLIERARRLSNPTWQGNWLNYKQLKRLIYDITDTDPARAVIKAAADRAVEAAAMEAEALRVSSSSSASPPDAAATAATTATTATTAEPSGTAERSRAFFHALREELTKVDNFYTTQETILVGRAERFALELNTGEALLAQALKDTLPLNEATAAERQEVLQAQVSMFSRLMEACKVLYVDLVMLENYAVMNYGGFAKILKKHDKNTRFVTQEMYLRKVVNPKPFSTYMPLKDAIRVAETGFTRLQAMATAAGADGAGDGPVAGDGSGRVISSIGLSSEQLSSNDVLVINSLRSISEESQQVLPGNPSVCRAKSPMVSAAAAAAVAAAEGGRTSKRSLLSVSAVEERKTSGRSGGGTRKRARTSD